MSSSSSRISGYVTEEQQKAMKDLVALSEKQGRIIHTLSAKLEELGFGGLLDTRSGGPLSTPSSSSNDFGPTSGPIFWNGTVNDTPTFSIGGKLYKAHILTEDVVRQWNIRLNMRTKICKYNQELDRERNEYNKLAVNIQKNVELEERGEAIDSAEQERLKSMHSYSVRRFEILADENNMFGHQDQALDRKISRVITRVLTSSGQRTKEDPAPYLNHLADTIKEMYHPDEIFYNKIDIPDRSELDDLVLYSDTDDSGRQRLRRVNSQGSTSGSGKYNSSSSREASKSP